MSRPIRNLAILVGINAYEHEISPLKTPVNDASSLAQVLESAYNYDVRKLLDTEATLQGFHSLMENLKQGILTLSDNRTVRIEAYDQVLFYFAGHGIAFGGFDSSEGPQGYLIPQDAWEDNRSTFLPMQQLHDVLVELECLHLLVILDCCFAGAFRYSRNLVPYQKLYRERYERFMKGKAQQTLFSAAHDERALDVLTRLGIREENRTQENSPFAQALLQAFKAEGDLLSNGVMTATELYVYLDDKLAEITDRQTPGLSPLKHHEKSEYIFEVPDFNPERLEQAPPLDESTNPYRGLQPYEPEYSELFFGREKAIADLVDKVKQTGKLPLTVVVGPSGCGKSSLVKAGLIPGLQQEQWQVIAPMSPGYTPFKSLARAVLPETANQEQIDAFSDKLRQTPQSLTEETPSLAKEVRGDSSNASGKFLLVIDQLEELVTLCSSEQRKQFLEWLKRFLAASSEQLHIIITLRSDFEPQFAEAVWQKSQWMAVRFMVPPMTVDELRDIIEKPAAEKVLFFEPPELVDQLIDDVVQMPGALPLLSFTLSELYLKYLERRSDNRAMTREDYEELDGVIGALTQRAAEVYQSLVNEDPAYEQTIRHVMLRMVALEGGELARRRVSLSELQYPDQAKNKRVEKALKKFVEARLIVRNQDPTDETYVEPAHDALILGWERLLRWKNQNQENIVLQQSVRRAAQDWNERNGSLWNADPNLNKLSEIKQSNNNWLNQLETDFVQKSLNKRRRNRFTITAVGGFICLALGAVTVFLAQSKRREVENITAASGARLRTHDQLGAVLDAVRAGDKFEQMKGGLSGLYHRWFRRTIWAETQFEVTTTLHQALANTHEQNRLEGQEGEGHSDGVNDVAFSPECPNSERLIASASDDKNVKVWSLTGALFNEEDIKHEDYVSSVSFSPDCQILASGSYDGTVKLWKPDGTKIRTIRDNADRVTDIDFSRDGKIIAVAIDDPDGVGQVELWSPHGDLIDSFKGKTNEFSRVSFNSDGTKIALAGRKVKVWNRDGDDRDPQTFDAQADSVWGISFSPDGKMIASSSGDGTITLWNLDGERLGSKEEAHSGSINDLSFTPNGQAIASVGEDSLIKFWDLSNQEDVHGQIKLKPSQLYEKIYQGHEGAVNSISFSSDGELFATASKDDSVKLWSLSEELVNSVVQVHSSDDRIWRSYFSPNNQSLVLIRNDNGVELWHLNSGKQIQLREPNENEFLEVSFSQDGETIALLPGNSSEVTFWNSTGEPIGSLQDQALADRDGSIRGIQLSPDGKILATANSDYTIKLWNRETGSSIPIKAHDGDITNLKFSSDGAILASASEDNRVKLWNLEGELLKSLNGYSTPLRTLRFSPDDKFLAFLASKDRGNVIKLWNIEEQKLTSLPGHTEPVTSIRFSPDGGIIVSASRDDTIRLWSSSGQTLETLIGPEGWVDDVIFHPNSRILASFSALSNDNPIKLWSIDGREITTLNAASVQNIHFSQGGDKLIAVYDSGSFVSRNLNRLQLLELSCQRLEDYLQTHRNIETEDDLCQDYLVE